MHRHLIEVATAAAASAAIALPVLQAGTGLAHVPAAPAPDAPPWQVGCRETPVLPLAGSGLTGTATLCIAPSGTTARVEFDNASVGDVYMLWFHYQDHERGRVDDAAETFGERPASVAGRLAGAVADARTVTLAGEVPNLHPAGRWEATVQLFAARPRDPADPRSRSGQLLPPRPLRLGAPPAGSIPAGQAGSIVGQAVFRDGRDS